jgi:hypothetical protein
VIFCFPGEGDAVTGPFCDGDAVTAPPCDCDCGCDLGVLRVGLSEDDDAGRSSGDAAGEAREGELTRVMSSVSAGLRFRLKWAPP